MKLRIVQVLEIVFDSLQCPLPYGPILRKEHLHSRRAKYEVDLLSEQLVLDRQIIEVDVLLQTGLELLLDDFFRIVGPRHILRDARIDTLVQQRRQWPFVCVVRPIRLLVKELDLLIVIRKLWRLEKIYRIVFRQSRHVSGSTRTLRLLAILIFHHSDDHVLLVILRLVVPLVLLQDQVVRQLDHFNLVYQVVVCQLLTPLNDRRERVILRERASKPIFDDVLLLECICDVDLFLVLCADEAEFTLVKLIDICRPNEGHNEIDFLFVARFSLAALALLHHGQLLLMQSP